METYCPKCSHYESCEKYGPCRPVKEYLSQDNLSVFENSYTDKNGQKVSIVFSRSREMAFSGLTDIDIDSDPAFSTDSESPFSSFNPNLKQTGVFVDRFFNGFSIADVAEKYKVSKHSASNIYHHAVKRILEVLEIMDQGEAVRKKTQYAKQVEERSGSLPKGQRWYLLNKALGLMPSEIADLEGLKGSSSVRQLIIRTSDQLRAKEIRLIDCTPEESEEAKSRLDSHRAKRRERHARKKASK